MAIRAQAVVALLVVAFSGCGETGTYDRDSPPAEARLPGYGEVVLAYGTQVRFPDLGVSLSFDEVLEDSRCPVHPQIACGWEGNAAVEVGVTPDDGPRFGVVLNTTLEPGSVERSGVRIRLLEVLPVATDEGPIPAELYTVKLEVEPIG